MGDWGGAVKDYEPEQFTPAMLAPGKVCQEDSEFKDSLGYTASWRPAWKTISKNNFKGRKTENKKTKTLQERTEWPDETH